LFDHLAGLTELSLMWLPLQVVSWSVGPADACARWPSPTVRAWGWRLRIRVPNVAGLLVPVSAPLGIMSVVW